MHILGILAALVHGFPQHNENYETLNAFKRNPESNVAEPKNNIVTSISTITVTGYQIPPSQTELPTLNQFEVDGIVALWSLSQAGMASNSIVQEPKRKKSNATNYAESLDNLAGPSPNNNKRQKGNSDLVLNPNQIEMAPNDTNDVDGNEDLNDVKVYRQMRNLTTVRETIWESECQKFRIQVQTPLEKVFCRYWILYQ